MSFGLGSEGEASGDDPAEAKALSFRRVIPGGLLCVAGVLVAAGLGLSVAGCGGGDASGAQVDVYVAAPLCSGAKEELARHGAAAGRYEVAIECLAPSESSGGGPKLAVLGSNSRRATEDTAAVATLEPPGAASKFSRPILESANVPLVTSTSARTGMDRIIKAIEGAGSSTVRDDVREALEPS
jgi:hypothetical protein